MANRPRQIGTAYENHVLEAILKPVWPDASRAPLTGVLDYGDFLGVEGWLVEAKKRKRLQGLIVQWVNTVIGKTLWRVQKVRPGLSAREARRVAERMPWVLVCAGDKRNQPHIDIAVLPASLLSRILRAARASGVDLASV